MATNVGYKAKRIPKALIPREGRGQFIPDVIGRGAPAPAPVPPRTIPPGGRVELIPPPPQKRVEEVMFRYPHGSKAFSKAEVRRGYRVR